MTIGARRYGLARGRDGTSGAFMRVWDCDRRLLVIVGPGGSQHASRLGCSVLNISHTIVEQLFVTARG